jgi:hypothetical protein
MKLEKWALITEVISGLAIVATLVVLIIQVQDGTQVTMTANRQSIAERAERFLLAQATSPELARLNAKALDNQPFSDEEYFAFAAYIGAAIRIAEEAYLQFRDGQLEEGYWLSRGRNLVDSRFKSEVARETWQEWVALGWFDPEFAEWVNAALAERYPPD